MAGSREYGDLLARQPIHISLDGIGNLDLALGKIIPAMPDINTSQPPSTKALLFWLGCLVSESSDTGLHPYHEVVRDIYPNDLLYRAIRKRIKIERTEESVPEELVRVRLGQRLTQEVNKHCPKWAVAWMHAKFSLTPARDSYQ
ncbi:hypothetical protein ACQEVC_11675 [Plantactinospora sp. CA-294935]|uniref:hypothetical protein n=1 Tax=Plantactinospora sp. CA-294935 TaxID=3240012 RepID=UPI003D8BB51D